VNRRPESPKNFEGRSRIELRTGDILRAEADALVNTVNCVGVMGRGIALQFRKAFPTYFEAYAAACKAGAMRPGTVHVFDRGTRSSPRYLISFPTKDHWRGKSRIGDVESGLASLVATVRKLGIDAVAIPPLGCGLGGLSWPEVRRRIESAFDALPEVRVLLFAPGERRIAIEGTSPAAPPAMTPGRAALIGLMDRYLAGLMDPDVGLLEVHKAMYFMQEAGERLRLRYATGHDGPYAENLRHVLSAIDGSWISGFAEAVDGPDRPLTLRAGAAEEARGYLADHPTTLARFERVLDLIDGFESPFGMELLASVHWVAHADGARSAAEATERVHAWSPRKLRFGPKHVELAWDTLLKKGWITTAGSRWSAVVP
jgi:O-acetyl-ADP-ribose deacetylase (regulator of RNase III)